MANEYFRRCTQTNADVLGTGRYHDGIKAIPIDSGILTCGGWDGLNSPNLTYHDQHSSNNYFTTVNTLSNAPWNIRHSYGFDTDSNGDGWLCGSDMQPAAVAADRKELWKINKSTLAWSLVNNNLANMSNRVLHGFAIRKTTNEKFIFGGTKGYNLSDGQWDDIIKVSADGLTQTTVQTGLSILAGNNDGHVFYDPVRDIFHLVCTGGKYDSLEANKTYLSGHWTYNPSLNTLTQLSNFPGDPRQYSNLIWDYTDNVLLFVNGYAKPLASGVRNCAEVWYWNGNDWARKITRPYNVGTNKGTSHATALCWKADKVSILMGNENPTAWVYEKYEKVLL